MGGMESISFHPRFSYCVLHFIPRYGDRPCFRFFEVIEPRPANHYLHPLCKFCPKFVPFLILPAHGAPLSSRAHHREYKPERKSPGTPRWYAWTINSGRKGKKATLHFCRIAFAFYRFPLYTAILYTNCFYNRTMLKHEYKC